ncbi:MAG: NAD(P)H-hydrate dehydratase [Chloroflexi bacterium]|nr:NAD(P)H-hydrate dehydratase [Chloroflexota bacterium]
MKIVTAAEMREIEGRAAQRGISTSSLMNNAGLAVAREIRRWRGSVIGCHVLILVGPGNNGGDGLIAASYLYDWGAKVHLYLLYPRSEADPTYSRAKERGMPIIEAASDQNFTGLKEKLKKAEVVLDAILGTGKARPLTGLIKDVLLLARAYKEAHPDTAVIALDLPTGLDPDTGAADPGCLAADLTITLGYPKRGLFAFPGAEYRGHLVVADIGIPSALAEDVAVELMTPKWVASALPSRPIQANKGTFGKVMVVAGSINYIGAAYLASMGAIRVGAGLITLATPFSLQTILAAKLTEATFLPLSESEPGIIAGDAFSVLREEMKGYDVLLLGCGLGQKPEVRELISNVLFSSSLPRGIVLDADGLNTLAQVPQWWEKWTGDGVVSPHPGEMGRLLSLSVAEILSARIEVAQRAAVQWRKTVVLKGAYTVVVSSQGRVMLSPFANPGLATAGTGDVLAGTIAGLMAQGLSPFIAACCGVYLHGTAGEVIKEKLGDAGITAGDLLSALPLAIKELRI